MKGTFWGATVSGKIFFGIVYPEVKLYLTVVFLAEVIGLEMLIAFY